MGRGPVISRAAVAIASLLVGGASLTGCSDAPGTDRSNPVDGLAITADDIPSGYQIRFAGINDRGGSGTTLAGPEPCVTAKRNFERARRSSNSSIFDALRDGSQIEAEVYDVPVALLAATQALTCNRSESVRVVALPEDLLRKRASVVEVMTSDGRLMAVEGHIDSGTASAKVTVSNPVLRHHIAGSEVEVDRDLFWRVFRTQIAKIERRT